MSVGRRFQVLLAAALSAIACQSGPGSSAFHGSAKDAAVSAGVELPVAEHPEAPRGAACPGSTPALELPQIAQPASCFRYGWTRQLPGSGTYAAVAPDGSIAALSLVGGVRKVTVLSNKGRQLGAFSVEPYGDLVRAFPHGELVAASRSGQIRRFEAQASVIATIDLGQPIEDLAASPSGVLFVSWHKEGAGSAPGHGVVAAYSREGAQLWATQIKYDTAPSLATSPDGSVVATGRATCVACSGAAPGALLAFALVLDSNGKELAAQTALVDDAHPLGPLFVRSAFMGPRILLQELTTWPNGGLALPATLDVDPTSGVIDLAVSKNAPDFFSASDLGGTSCWARSFRALDESNHARLLAFYANAGGAVIDVNGDVYKVHHIMRLSAAGTVRWRYDRPNDGSMNDVALAGIDLHGMVVLSGRFEGKQDFDPGPALDMHTATIESRRYVTALFDCDDI